MSKIFDEIREEGHEEGREEAQLNCLKALMKNLNFTVEQAMDAVSVPAEDRDFYRSELSWQRY